MARKPTDKDEDRLWASVAKTVTPLEKRSRVSVLPARKSAQKSVGKPAQNSVGRPAKNKTAAPGQLSCSFMLGEWPAPHVLTIGSRAGPQIHIHHPNRET